MVQGAKFMPHIASQVHVKGLLALNQKLLLFKNH